MTAQGQLYHNAIADVQYVDIVSPRNILCCDMLP